MSAFDLTEFANINDMLYFKLNNPPQFHYGRKDKNMFYTTLCLDKYEKSSRDPRLYAPDLVVVTYVYWYSENGYDEGKQDNNACSPIVVLDHVYDEQVIKFDLDIASYYNLDASR